MFTPGDRVAETRRNEHAPKKWGGGGKYIRAQSLSLLTKRRVTLFRRHGDEYKLTSVPTMLRIAAVCWRRNNGFYVLRIACVRICRMYVRKCQSGDGLDPRRGDLRAHKPRVDGVAR